MQYSLSLGNEGLQVELGIPIQILIPAFWAELHTIQYRKSIVCIGTRWLIRSKIFNFIIEKIVILK